MIKNANKISSHTIVISYTLGFILLIIMIGSGLYFIDYRYKQLQNTIDNQFSLNFIMKKLTDISRYRAEIMVDLLDENDPFIRDDLIQEYNGQTREFLKHRENLLQLNLSKIQMDIFENTMSVVGKAYIDQVETLRLVNAEKISEARSLFTEKILPEKIKIRESYDELIYSMQKQAQIEINDAERLSKVTMLIIIALLTLVFLLSIWIQFMAFRVTRRYNQLLIDSNEKLEQTVVERTKELKLAKEDAEKSNLVKSKFLTGMSHELRTPMNAILGFGQILQLDTHLLNKDQNENIDNIISAGSHLMTLIEELLNLSKIESGKMDLDIEPVILEDLLKQCITLITPQANKHQVEIINQISEKSHIIKGDLTRLKQIVLNLLSNAVKYGNDSSEVIIDANVVDGNRICIRITDTGVGLTQENIDKLFTSFERLDKNQDTEGTGLGLVITKSLIEIMGGRIGIESTLGEGSTFWIEIPLHEE